MTDFTRKTFLKKLSTALGYYPIVFMLGYLWATLFFHVAFILPTLGYAHMVFSNTLDLVQGIGPVYWIIRKDPRKVSVGLGTMHELGSPWRKGQGVYLVLFHRSFQIGLCHRQQFDDITGTLSAVQGRYLDLSAKEIGNWNAVQKDTKARTTTA